MKSPIKAKDRSLIEQVLVMKKKHPHFTTSLTSHSSMKVSGTMQPTARSEVYHFVLTYTLADNPKVKIVSPVLEKNEKGEEIPHLYPGGHLCLYHPRYGEFSRTYLLCETIIPWTSLWLYHYEIWHVTGDWLGGGEHPVKLKPINK